MEHTATTRRSVLAGLGGTAALAGTGTASELLDDGATDTLEEIEILRDEFNVSHVYADDLYSLAYGNGYVQARDRLFQLEVFRLIAKGESASMLGSGDRKSTRLNSSHIQKSRMPSSA